MRVLEEMYTCMYMYYVGCSYMAEGWSLYTISTSSNHLQGKLLVDS